MLESLILNGLGTFFNENSSIEIKKIGNELTIAEKVHIGNMFQIIVSFVILLFTWNTKFILNTNLVAIIIVTVIGSLCFSYFVQQAIVKADRSTNGLFSTVSIPLLLVSDILLRYDITTYHIVGIIFILTTLITISLRGSVNLTGVKYALATQIFAFVNIMIFKIAITNYISTELMNIITSLCVFLITFLYILTKKGSKESISRMYQRKYIKFGLLGGLGGAFNSMGYLFGPASIITALKRILSMFWGVVMGKIYFHEDKFYQKLSSVAVISIGVVIMNFPLIVSNKALLVNVNTALLIKGDIKGYKQNLKVQNPTFKEEIARPEMLYSQN